uniref:Ig-like domain-containing protein n=1 Tax=Myripristis murdjan TaxID=586833 RepID=A0A667XE62_9TELE
MTGSRSAPSRTSGPSPTTEACTASGVRSSWSWPGRTRGRSTPAGFTTPVSLRRPCTVCLLPTGTPPNVMFINCEPLCPLLNQECTLHLCIKDFCPEDVSVSWFKDGEELLSGVFNTPPSLNISGLYSMFSFLKLTPDKDDRGSQFRCRVVHSAQKEPEERLFTLPRVDMTVTD